MSTPNSLPTSAPSTPAGFGKVVLAATPIGNPADASKRLRDLLQQADVIAAEDTRRTRRLAQDLGIELRGDLISVHEHNESARVNTLLERLQQGALVVVVSDAGMPTVSDPGYRFVQSLLELDPQISAAHFTVAPGPSAVLMALALSGLPTDRFSFEGFAPRKGSERRRMFEGLNQEMRTMVFFESTHRISDFLADAATVFGTDRRAALCRELTKTYEQTVRGTLADLVAYAAEGVKGEICVVIGGAEKSELSVQDLVAKALVLAADGMRLKDAAKQVCEGQKVSSREVYTEALASK